MNECNKVWKSFAYETYRRSIKLKYNNYSTFCNTFSYLGFRLIKKIK